MASDCLQGRRPFLFCSWLKFVAVGVRGLSASVDHAGGDKSIVLINADTWGGAGVTARGREGTGRLRKARKPIGGARVVAGTG
jgi:hypothetical protein